MVLGMRLPTMSTVVRALVRKGWVTQASLSSGGPCCVGVAQSVETGSRTEDSGPRSRRAERSHTKEGAVIMTHLRLFVGVCVLLFALPLFPFAMTVS